MNRTERNAIRIGLALGTFLGMVGCRATVAPVQVENVGQLAPSYNSIAVAPLKHDAPPELAFVAGSDDDDVSSVATTVTRADAGEADAAPEVVGKGGGIVLGGSR